MSKPRVTTRTTSRCPENITPLLDTNNSRFWVYPNFTADIYPILKKQLARAERKIRIEPSIRTYGKDGVQHRNILFLSDESKGYKYSGQLMPSEPLDTIPIAKKFLLAVNDFFNTDFNGILINIYIDGTKYIGAHSDDESALDPETNLVLGIVYGPATRPFRLREKQSGSIVRFSSKLCEECGVAISQKKEYLARSRDLIAMEGDFQKFFKHEVPADKSILEERISLTLRRHLE